MVELLEDLREVIGNHYQLQLFGLLREQRCTQFASKPENAEENDPPF